MIAILGTRVWIKKHMRVFETVAPVWFHGRKIHMAPNTSDTHTPKKTAILTDFHIARLGFTVSGAEGSEAYISWAFGIPAEEWV